MHRFVLIAVVALAAAAGCAPLSVVVKSDVDIAGLKAPALPTYVEPFTEAAALEMRSTTSGDTTVYYKDKPFFAQPDTLDLLYRGSMKKLASVPDVKPLAAGRLDAATGTVQVVRTTISKHTTVSNSVFLETLVAILPCGFLCPFGIAYPLIVPAESNETIEGVVQVFDVDAAELVRRLVAVRGRVDPEFDSTGLQPAAQREFHFDYHAEFGLFTTRPPDATATPVIEPLTNAIRAAVGGGAPKTPSGPTTL